MPCFEVKTWIVGLDNDQEIRLATALAQVFSDFLDSIDIAKKSEKTRRRYLNALDGLGGYLVADVFNHDNYEHSIDAFDLLNQTIYPDDGPLIFQDVSWQNEVDVVCRKLYKYLHKKKKFLSTHDLSHLHRH
jgi:hypothetical protein